jgi:hypothetical protein
MSKLYVFGIGGTGSRVLKALTMLMATGVKCAEQTIIPIIIDPDEAAADLTRTVEVMRKYRDIRDKLNFAQADTNEFFKVDIQESVPNFRLPLKNIADVTFDNYMGVSTMSKANRAVVNMLFSEANLSSEMQVGFKGNPNIGSVVLNQFDSSIQFNEFANGFQQDDKIFIISSIFGGTGASGFPLLLKILRTNNRMPNFNLINNAQIGAITVLPYFGVKQDENSKIDSATFISKTKSALSYYERNISKNNSINYLYYVADRDISQYDNHEGGMEQQNNAHFIELVSALAILDFAASPFTSTANPIHKEYGIQTNYEDILFDDLGHVTQKLIMKSLIQFVLFAKYMKERSRTDYLAQPWTKDRGFDNTFFDGHFIKDIKSFQQIFQQWLKEMETQKRKFSPFELQSKIFNVVRGIKPRRLLTWASNYDLFDARLNAISSAGNNKEQQFIELFYKATERLVKDKFNIR